MITATLSHRLRRIPPALLLYLLGIYTLGFALDGGIFAVLQNLFLLRLGYGPEFVGIFNSVGLFVFAALSLPVGTIRRWSGRQMLLSGLIVMWLGSLMIPAAQYLPADWRTAALLAGKVISHVGLAFYFVHAAPFIMGITSGHWQNRALAWQSAVLNVAGFSGGLLAGYLPGWIATWLGQTLDDPTPYGLPLFIGALILLVTFAAIYRLPNARPSDDDEEESLRQNQAAGQMRWLGPLWLFVIALTAVRILQVAAPGAVITFGNVFFDDGLGVATELIGILSALGKLVSVPMALLVPFLLRRWGGFNSVMVISIVSIVATLPLVLSENWAVTGISLVLATAAGPLRYLAFLVFTMGLVPAGRRALVSGAGEMAIGFGFAAISFAGGYLIAAYGYAAMFTVSLVATAIGTALFLLLFGRYRTRKKF